MTSDDRGQIMDGWPMIVTTTIIVAMLIGHVGVQFAVETYGLTQPAPWLSHLSVAIFVVLVLAVIALPLYAHNVGSGE
jgi:hypothetical protein